MTTLTQALRKQGRSVLLGGVALSILLTPAFAQSAEREGSVLFFSVEDLQQTLSHPSHLWFSMSWQQPPSFAWRERPETAERGGPLGRNARYGNGLGIDGYRLPGTRPLWGD